MDTLYKKLADAIRRHPKKRIGLDELYKMMEKSLEGEYINIVSWSFETKFQQLVHELIEGGVLEPLKTLKPNHRGLYLKYKKVIPSEKNDNIKSEIIASISQPMDVRYYLANPKVYLDDKEYIRQLSLFFENNPSPKWVTVNERSYEIFGDEKFLRGSVRTRSRGESILQRLGLTYEDLYCRLTLEPFFCFAKDGLSTKPHSKIYIIENKDTFWSFKGTAFQLDSNQEIDMVIYGEGKKIISSFQFVSEYGLDIDDEYYYFGDLDPEGINIYVELDEHYRDYNIIPYIEGYRQLMLTAKEKEIKKVPKDQVLNKDSLLEFIKYFSQEEGNEIRDILLNGGYIPQEAFSAEKMRKLFSS